MPIQGPRKDILIPLLLLAVITHYDPVRRMRMQTDIYPENLSST